MSALEKANRVRLANKKLKREVAAGHVDWRDVLKDPPEHAAAMQIAHLLAAVPRFGETRVGQVLAMTSIPPQKPIGRLTAPQAQRVIDVASGTVNPRENPLVAEVQRLRQELWLRSREIVELKDEVRVLRNERRAYGRVAA